MEKLLVIRTAEGGQRRGVAPMAMLGHHEYDGRHRISQAMCNTIVKNLGCTGWALGAIVEVSGSRLAHRPQRPQVEVLQPHLF